MFHNPTPLNVSQKSGPRYSCISYITTRTSLRRRSYTGVRDAAHFSHFPDRDRTGARNARGHTMGHTPWPGSARHARAPQHHAPRCRGDGACGGRGRAETGERSMRERRALMGRTTDGTNFSLSSLALPSTNQLMSACLSSEGAMRAAGARTLSGRPLNCHLPRDGRVFHYPYVIRCLSLIRLSRARLLIVHS